MGRKLALLRGINVAGSSRALRMVDLRALCEELGWGEVATYIQSGNVLFSSPGSPDELEEELEQAIRRRFGMNVTVIVRAPDRWSAYIAGNPFADGARDTPNWLLLLVAKEAAPFGIEEELQARARNGERVGRAGDGLWIYYPNSLARSKLSPLLIDTLLPSRATSRNYRTVTRLSAMLEG